MDPDIGKYNFDPIRYKELVDELYKNYPYIKLPPEYNEFIQENLLRMLIRLARYKFVARMIKKTDHCLEVGCGSGIGSIFISQYCAHVTAIDTKSTEIEEARSISSRKNLEFEVCDLFDLNDNLKWDVIILLDVIEHMPVEDGCRLINNIAQHLKQSGMVIIGTPSIYSYEYQGPLSKASHVKCYDLEELIYMIDNNFGRTISFSMNDEVVHTGFSKLAWYYFVLGFLPK